MLLLKMTRLGLLATAILMVASVQYAKADVRVTYETDGKTLFSIAAPDGWVVATGGSDADGGAPRILGMNPEDDLSLWVGFLSPAEPKDVEEAEAYVKDLSMVNSGAISTKPPVPATTMTASTKRIVWRSSL